MSIMSIETYMLRICKYNTSIVGTYCSISEWGNPIETEHDRKSGSSLCLDVIYGAHASISAAHRDILCIPMCPMQCK